MQKQSSKLNLHLKLYSNNQFLKAYLHKHEIVNKTFNDDRQRDVGPHRCSKRQSFDVSSGSNTAWSKR